MERALIEGPTVKLRWTIVFPCLIGNRLLILGAVRPTLPPVANPCWAFSERVALSAFTSYQATIIDGDSNGFGADRHEFIVARENPGWGLIRKQADNDRTRSSAHDVIAPYGRVGFYRQRIVERTPMNDSR